MVSVVIFVVVSVGETAFLLRKLDHPTLNNLLFLHRVQDEHTRMVRGDGGSKASYADSAQCDK